MAVKRFGVSLEENLLNDLDEIVKTKRFPNRSQAIRFLINKNKVEDKWEMDDVVAGAIVLVYDHHNTDIVSSVTSLQHEYNCLVLALQHVHIDKHNCLETIAVQGKAHKIAKLANKLIAIKGIKHGNLVMTAPD